MDQNEFANSSSNQWQPNQPPNQHPGGPTQQSTAQWSSNPSPNQFTGGPMHQAGPANQHPNQWPADQHQNQSSGQQWAANQPTNQSTNWTADQHKNQSSGQHQNWAANQPTNQSTNWAANQHQATNPSTHQWATNPSTGKGAEKSKDKWHGHRAHPVGACASDAAVITRGSSNTLMIVTTTSDAFAVQLPLTHASTDVVAGSTAAVPPIAVVGDMVEVCVDPASPSPAVVWYGGTVRDSSSTLYESVEPGKCRVYRYVSGSVWNRYS